jgi:hypothetical protein
MTEEKGIAGYFSSLLRNLLAIKLDAEEGYAQFLTWLNYP